MAWTGIAATYIIRDARIVVLVQNGGAVVETRDIEYTEGRHASDYNRDLGEELPSLNLLHGFTEVDAPVPDAMVTVPGRIVIDGMTENGRIEIRGHGDFGYDERGHILGDFDDLPVILIDKFEQPETEDRNGMTIEEWSAHMDSIEPQTSAEFDRATRGRRVKLDDTGFEIRDWQAG